MKYILFGSGLYGKKAIDYFGEHNIAYFMDNNPKKVGTKVYGKTILSFDKGVKLADKYEIIITVSVYYQSECASQLINAGIVDYKIFSDILYDNLRQKILTRTDYIGFYHQAIKFIFKEILAQDAVAYQELNSQDYFNIVKQYRLSLFRFGYNLDKMKCLNRSVHTGISNYHIIKDKLLERVAAQDLNNTADMFYYSSELFKDGDVESGKKYFYKALHLQMNHEYFYGMQVREDGSAVISDNMYVKYMAMNDFLDALYNKSIAEFDMFAPNFVYRYQRDDGRYIFIKEAIEKINIEQRSLSIIDVGCGKGGYLRNLVEDAPQNEYYAVDISNRVMEHVDLEGVHKKQGSLLHIPYEDETFDIAYTCEAMEHAIDIPNAIKEMVRVVKAGGYIIILDKNKDKYGAFEICEWEQWIDEHECVSILSKYSNEINTYKDISYFNLKDGLFIGLVVKKFDKVMY